MVCERKVAEVVQEVRAVSALRNGAANARPECSHSRAARVVAVVGAAQRPCLNQYEMPAVSRAKVLRAVRFRKRPVVGGVGRRAFFL